MNSHLTRDFRSQLAALPQPVQHRARQAYALFRQDPWHASLRFKGIRGATGIYSVRIGTGYRAIGHRDGSDITWFWIGSHSEYSKLLEQRC